MEEKYDAGLDMNKASDLQLVYSSQMCSCIKQSYSFISSCFMCHFTAERTLRFAANLCAWPCNHSITLPDKK